jgi:hypothetical protein
MASRFDFATRAMQLLNRRDRPDYLASPWTEGAVSKIVWADVFGADYAPIGRADAMAIPAFSRARDLICNTVAELSLVAVTGRGATTTVLTDDKQPRWMYRTDGAISPYLRMMWTVDDLLHYGASAWGVERGADGFPLNAWRIPYEDWDLDDEGYLTDPDGKRYGRNAIYIPSHTAGVIDRSEATLKAAANIQAAVAQRASVPIPVMEIRLTADYELDDEPDENGDTEADRLVKGYAKARQNPNGAVVLSPPGVELYPHGGDGDAGFMVEGRNAVRLDMGNITGVPGALLDGSTATATLTYSTSEGKSNEFREYGAGLMLNTLRSRLSQDDMLPSGQRAEFDFTVEDASPQPPIDTTRQD